MSQAIAHSCSWKFYCSIKLLDFPKVLSNNIFILLVSLGFATSSLIRRSASRYAQGRWLRDDICTGPGDGWGVKEDLKNLKTTVWWCKKAHLPGANVGSIFHNTSYTFSGLHSLLHLLLFTVTCNLCVVQFHPLPSPPGNSRDKSSPSCPGVEDCLRPSYPGGRGAVQIKKLLLAFGLSNTMVKHRLLDIKRFFVGKPIEIVSAWLEQNNLSKLN